MINNRNVDKLNVLINFPNAVAILKGEVIITIIHGFLYELIIVTSPSKLGISLPAHSSSPFCSMCMELDHIVAFCGKLKSRESFRTKTVVWS